MSSPALPRPCTAFLTIRPGMVDRVFARGRRERLATLCDLRPVAISPENWEPHRELLAQVEVLFSTWRATQPSAAFLDAMPRLRAIFHAAGSVKGFARPFLERDIVVVSSAAANAVSVAEFTLAQILLANKGFLRNTTLFRTRAGHAEAARLRDSVFPGNAGTPVVLLGAGHIGRRVLHLLRPFELQTAVWDPFLDATAAKTLGVEKIESLEAAFARGAVVSNHVAHVPATRGLLRGAHFEAMPPYATFLNTGRGGTVVEAELIDVLTRRTDLTAVLDVTQPEPPREDSPFYRLPNVHLSSHIAGVCGPELARVADYAIDEFVAWSEGRPLRAAVTLEQWDRLA